MVIGEEGVPQGVCVGGRTARGVKGGEGREERPVPPSMAMGTGSAGIRYVQAVDQGWLRLARVGVWEAGHSRSTMGGTMGGTMPWVELVVPWVEPCNVGP